MLDMTARLRDQALRQHAEATGTPYEEQPFREHPRKNYTGKLAREMLARNEGDDYDGRWLYMFGQVAIPSAR